MTTPSATHDPWPRSAVGPVRLADTLGWASMALGAPMLVAPRRFLRAIGVRDHRSTIGWAVAVGVREHVATLNIITNRQRRIGMWSRVAGDTMDAALLAAAYRGKRHRADAGRLRAALGAVGGILALDLYTAVALSRAEGVDVSDGSGSRGVGADHDTAARPDRVRTAVTIRRSEDEVRRAFRQFEWTALNPTEAEASGGVRFIAAPGERGTEVHVDIRDGGAGSMAAKALGRSPAQRTHDELRRFKAVVETGAVARSETSPEGPSAARQIWHKRRSAQPLEEPV